MKCVIFLLGLATATLFGQTVDSGSDGTDGALNLDTPGSILFDPTSFNPPLDPDGDGIYHFTTVNIAEGVTVKLRADVMGYRPVIWLVSGAVVIDGILDLSGEDGHDANTFSRRLSVPGPGGFPGGIGKLGIINASAGFGPGGGSVPSGGAGHRIEGPGDTGGNSYGSAYVIPIIGGSGGAGYSDQFYDSGAGGGAGGGAIVIVSSVSIHIDGEINANGGSGVKDDESFFKYGGGGSGGAIKIVGPLISGNGTIEALGGPGNYGTSSYGNIRLEAFQNTFSGDISFYPRIVTPGVPFLPQGNEPEVKIVKIDGVDVPDLLFGNFISPDVVINNSQPVSLEIQTKNIPLGTIITLTIFSEEANVVTVDSTPVVGTFESGTAIADYTFPSGFSIFAAQATW